MSDTTPAAPLSDREFAHRALLTMTGVGAGVTSDLTDAGVEPYVVGNHPMTTLLILADDGPTRPVELAERVGMTSGGMTKVIDRLEQLELVERDPDAVADGRGLLVRLTTDGRRTVDTVLDASVPRLRKAVSELSSLPI